MKSIIITWPVCNCHGFPHNKLKIVTDTGHTLTEVCQYVAWLMSAMGNRRGTYPFDLALAEPPQEWRDVLGAMDDD